MANETVSDDEELCRCIRAEYVRIVDGYARCTERGFLDVQRRISVDRVDLCGSDPEYSRRDVTDYVALLLTGEVRAIDSVCRRSSTGVLGHKYAIVVAPDPLDGNPAHALIFADEDLNGSAFKRLQEELADLAEFVAYPVNRLD